MPPQTGWSTEVHGRRVFARSWSGHRARQARPVVLVHGLGIGSRMCEPAARLLARSRPVHALDLPGFGHSRGGRTLTIDEHADWLATWMRASSLSGAIVAGVSVGSQVVAALAQRHPDLCDLVALVSPTVDANRRSWSRQLPRWQVEQATQSLRMRGIQVTDFARAGPRRVIRTFASALADHPEDRMPGIEHPLLVCWGTRDPLLSRDWVEHLTELAPHGHLAVLPGAVHAMTHDSPLELARVLERFLGDHSRPEQGRMHATSPSRPEVS